VTSTHAPIPPPLAGGDRGGARAPAPFRVVRPVTAISRLAQTLGRGCAAVSSDPCFRSGPAGSGQPIWRATRTPVRGRRCSASPPTRPWVEVQATAWGQRRRLGCWTASRTLIGMNDDPSGFQPSAGAPAPWSRALAGPARLAGAAQSGRCSRRWVPGPGALEQRVTGLEARRAWRALVVKFGEAPRPARARPRPGCTCRPSRPAGGRSRPGCGSRPGSTRLGAGP